MQFHFNRCFGAQGMAAARAITVAEASSAGKEGRQKESLVGHGPAAAGQAASAQSAPELQPLPMPQQPIPEGFPGQSPPSGVGDSLFDRQPIPLQGLPRDMLFPRPAPAPVQGIPIPLPSGPPFENRPAAWQQHGHSQDGLGRQGGTPVDGAARSLAQMALDGSPSSHRPSSDQQLPSVAFPASSRPAPQPLLVSAPSAGLPIGQPSFYTAAIHATPSATGLQLQPALHGAAAHSSMHGSSIRPQPSATVRSQLQPTRLLPGCGQLPAQGLPHSTTQRQKQQPAWEALAGGSGASVAPIVTAQPQLPFLNPCAGFHGPVSQSWEPLGVATHAGLTQGHSTAVQPTPAPQAHQQQQDEDFGALLGMLCMGASSQPPSTQTVPETSRPDAKQAEEEVSVEQGSAARAHSAHVNGESTREGCIHQPCSSVCAKIHCRQPLVHILISCDRRDRPSCLLALSTERRP
jgi:hypothetical protein